MAKKDNKSSGLLTDFELVDLIRNGRRDMIKELYHRYAAKIYRKCYAILKNKQEAEDLSHDILIKILTKLNTFKGNSAFSLWVHAVSYNHCINHIRRSKKLNFQEPGSWENLKDDGNDDIQEKQELEIKIDQLHQLMERLKVEERLVLTMFYKDGMPIKQISGILEVSESAVKMRLKRSREKLYNLFKNNG